MIGSRTYHSIFFPFTGSSSLSGRLKIDFLVGGAVLMAFSLILKRLYVSIYSYQLNNNIQLVGLQNIKLSDQRKPLMKNQGIPEICKLLICHFTLDNRLTSWINWLFLRVTLSLKCKRLKIFSSPSNEMGKEDISFVFTLS